MSFLATLSKCNGLQCLYVMLGRVAKLETELKQKQGKLQELHEQMSSLQVCQSLSHTTTIQHHLHNSE